MGQTFSASQLESKAEEALSKVSAQKENSPWPTSEVAWVSKTLVASMPRVV